jgi:hypothetical protein
MLKEIIFYILGLLSVCSFLMLWFVSPLKITLAKLFFNTDITDIRNFDDLLYIKSKFLSKLLSCWICCSFWLSLILGMILGYMCNNFYFPLVAFCTYPSLAYIFKRVID